MDRASSRIVESNTARLGEASSAWNARLERGYDGEWHVAGRWPGANGPARRGCDAERAGWISGLLVQQRCGAPAWGAFPDLGVRNVGQADYSHASAKAAHEDVRVCADAGGDP